MDEMIIIPYHGDHMILLSLIDNITSTCRVMCSVYHLVVVYSSEIILKEKNRSKYQNIQLHSILDLQMSSYPFDICMNIWEKLGCLVRDF